MKAINFSSLSGTEARQVFEVVKATLNESLQAYGVEHKFSLRNVEFDEYRDSLITDLWNEEGEFIGEGFSAISFDVVLDDEESFKKLFNQAKDEAFDEYIDFLRDAVVGCEPRKVDAEIEVDEDGAWAEGYDCVSNVDHYFDYEASELFDLLNVKDTEFAGYFGYYVADINGENWYFKKY